MNEDDVKAVMRVPWVSIGSDGSALNLEISRQAAPAQLSAPIRRVLGKYTREEKVLTLEDARRKMTSMPAQVLGLKDRGLLREGYWGDVVVFDPDTVADTADLRQSEAVSESAFRMCLVNGSVVIDSNT